MAAQVNTYICFSSERHVFLEFLFSSVISSYYFIRY